MSLKSKVLAAAATLTLVGGIATAGAIGAGTATAATPSCGASCVDLFSYEFGHHFTPGFLLDVYQRHIKIGQPIILYRSANNDPAEDFRVEFQGTVADFYAANMVSSALALNYGCGFNLETGQCSATVNPFTGKPFPDDWAFELEYSPNGVLSGLCAGLAATASSGEDVTLQECGSSSKTVWVIDQADSSNGLTPVLDEYAPLINGSDTFFSQPYVLTYPANGYPTDKPRPELQVGNLTGFTSPGTGDPAGVDSNQLWGTDFGPFAFEV